MGACLEGQRWVRFASEARREGERGSCGENKWIRHLEGLNDNKNGILYFPPRVRQLLNIRYLSMSWGSSHFSFVSSDSLMSLNSSSEGPGPGAPERPGPWSGRVTSQQIQSRTLTRVLLWSKLQASPHRYPQTECSILVLARFLIQIWSTCMSTTNLCNVQ